MCGIAGIIGRPTAESAPRVQEMISCMPYRGPNDRGVWGEGMVTLGHLRLSIIDTTNCGHQPMASTDNAYQIIFNGEIFNYIELREELKRLGSVFHSPGDTEVILEAYRHWGIECVKRFNGMWAFALWDSKKQRLFCSRDRFGVKPFFYTFENGVLQFASEMKALLRNAKGQPDWSYLYRFFDRKTPLGSDRTVFQGIHHLRPAHNLVFESGAMTITRFWEPDPAAFREVYDYSDPVATFKNLLTDSVRLRLRSDVPVGVCLSGGLDSSVIAVLLKSFGVTAQTFSSVYDEPAYSERSFIDTVNTAIQAKPHFITPQSNDFFTVMENIVEHHDEPVRMPGVYSHWHVMDCASKGVTVVLDGQGADEILGGYREYYPPYMASLIRDMLSLRNPGDAWTQLQACLKGLQDNMGESSSFLREALLRVPPASLRALAAHTGEKEQLFTEDFRNRHATSMSNDPEEVSFLGRYSSLLDTDMRKHFVETNLPMLLRYEDRNSMAFSIEARVPFLDYRVVEFCQGLSYRNKIRGYTSKWILREAFKDMLPPSIYERKDKKGFPTPAALWFRGPLQEEVRRRLQSGALHERGIVNAAYVQKILDQHMDGTKNHERTIFRLLTLDIWLGKYVG
jgi:asparagine synthase (glutamine-hydrolysing)